MRIKNALVYEESKTFKKRDVCIENGKFVAYAGGEEIDAEGLYLIPGLVDIHTHGAVGADASDGDGEGIARIAEYEASHGVTSFCPTTMSMAKEQLVNIMSALGNYESKSGAKVAGVNMEGPFINPNKKGAQKLENIIPCDYDFYKKLNELTGNKIKLLGLAPETKGGFELIENVQGEVKVSLAHSEATYEDAMKAISMGAKHVTHLYNAMSPFYHREPGIIGAAVDSGDTVVELITDGVHVHPAMIRSTFKMFDADNIALVSDSMRATGLEDGQYTLGGQQVNVKGNKATLKGGTIAGSVTNLFDCMKYAVKEASVPLEVAINSATMVPAREIGMQDEIGSIKVGKAADLILMDKDLNIKAVFVDGNRI